MRVNIYCDERYPDYGIDRKPRPHERTIEISTELLAEVDAADAAYRAAQTKLRELYNHQKYPSEAA